jgi:uncharacterized protein YaeQ
MALGGTVHNFELSVSDIDAGRYETLTVQVARHPSESLEYLVTRILAYALEHREGIAFSQGLHVADEPAVWVHDLTGSLVAVFEIGTPEVSRVHKASKASDQVVIYCHKDAPTWLAAIAGEKIHAPQRVSIVEVPRALVQWLGERVERRNKWDVSLNEGELYVGTGDDTMNVPWVRHPWPSRAQ